MTNDGSFRLIVAVTTATAQGATSAQDVGGLLAIRLSELLTGAVLVRETTAPGRRVQLVLRYAAGGSLVADSLPSGVSRGLVNAAPEDGGFGGPAILQVNYTLPNGSLHQGVIDVPGGATISSALMRYMHHSEQTVSMIVVEALLGDDGEPRAVGGYLVQLLPEATKETIAAMTTHLERFERIDGLREAEPSVDAIVDALFAGVEFTRLADSPLEFGCTCSEERVLAGIMSLPNDDVKDMADAAQQLEVRCDACGRRYEVEPETLRALAMRPAIDEPKD
jgi:molecular chaperone Hsp33